MPSEGEQDILQEYEKFRLEFKEKYDIDIGLEDFKKIKESESRARDIQKEVQEFGIPGISAEENNAKCNNCSSGLSYVEHMLYGNRCVFCVDQKKKINPFIFMLRCFMDWIIYRELLRISRDKGQEGRVYLLGCLGAIGYTDINQVKGVLTRLLLLKELMAIR
ncbi:hypothetical protein EPO66_00160 [bacterium]|nr:MAG: hypothetical protein EPO66_00160 [bacterium]